MVHRGEAVRALNQGDAPADALDKFLVAAAFDWVVRKNQDVEVAGRGGAERPRGEDLYRRAW